MKLTIFHIASPFLTIKPSYNGLSATFKDRPHLDILLLGWNKGFAGKWLTVYHFLYSKGTSV
jgi:hypothetical protein